MPLNRRPQGRLWLSRDGWHLSCAPHIAMALKRTFPRVELHKQQFHFKHTPEACWDLKWFATKYPLEIVSKAALEAGAATHERDVAEIEAIASPTYVGRPIPLAHPLREYQASSVHLINKTGHLLVADDLGLGKTVTAIGAMATKNGLPAGVVTYSHLQLQWHREVREFLPNALPHIIRGREMYEPGQHNITNRFDKEYGRCVIVDGVRMTPEEHDKWCQAAGLSVHKRGKVKTRFPDVLIMTYSKMPYWADYLGTILRLIVWDEIQELRCNRSEKYSAAHRLASNVPIRVGLSATPVYNYGGESFNIMESLAPGALGEWSEFCREWCAAESNDRGKTSLKDSAAFGAYLRSEHLMVRHTRVEVGRELPPVSRSNQLVACDTAALDKISEQCAELAKVILGRDSRKMRGIDQMQAGSEFVNLLRKTTGIAKAVEVAAFVKMLLESGEPVILSGWHRAVYDIWLDVLKDYNPMLYTGSEGDAQKDRARSAFISGKTKLLILSNRSGAGLNGLEGVCRTGVVGEFDWSPGPHKQFIGRLNRDGQTDPVMIYFLYCNSGSDPILLDTLGLKAAQQKGIEDPWASNAPHLVDQTAEKQARQMAYAYLARMGAA